MYDTESQTNRDKAQRTRKREGFRWQVCREQSPVPCVPCLDGITAQHPIARIVLSMVYYPSWFAWLCSNCSQIVKIDKNRGKISGGLRPMLPPGLAVHGPYFASFIMFELLFSKCSRGKILGASPQGLQSLDPASGGFIPDILLELLFSNCSQIVKIDKNQEKFPGASPHDPTRACNPWTLLVGAVPPSYCFKLLSDCQKSTKIGKIFRH